MDISKAIDKGQALGKARAYEFTEWMRSTGITVKQISEATGTATMGGHYLDTSSQPAIATADLFDKLRPLLPEVPERIERLVAERTGIEWSDYVKREVVGSSTNGIAGGTGEHAGESGAYGFRKEFNLTASASDAAQRWDGWGTALKPAIEPIILARKPLVGTVAGNVLAWGVGGLNIDASRVPSCDSPRGSGNSLGYHGGGAGTGGNVTPPAGRFPANVLLDEHAAQEMDKQSGNRPGGNFPAKLTGKSMFGLEGHEQQPRNMDDSGGASRFFPVFKYQAKAPKRERPVVEREDGTKIQHPTVKPVALMEWLVELITPPGGTVLDPFAGSGTTLQAARNKNFHAIGIEQDADYIKLIETRLAG